MSEIKDLPVWVFDMVAALKNWSDEHPKLYADYAMIPGYSAVDACGCEALAFVPAEVLAIAEVVGRVRKSDE